MKGLKITETVLMDANQSLLSARLTTDEMLPALEMMDSVGYHSLDAWGGATFDACLRFLNEDPWERLRSIKSRVKHTKLQMLLRSQSLLGYRQCADDVVEYFVQKSIANGIDIIRIFDSLNDIRNLEKAIKACVKEGGHAQAALCYMTSPHHDIERFVDDAKMLVEMGAQSICIMDDAGILTPFTAHDLIKALKKSIKVPVQLHAHNMGGIASMTYFKAIEAGVDIIDCCISTAALAASQPSTESFVAALKDTKSDTGLDLSLLSRIADHFKPVVEKYINDGTLEFKAITVDDNTLMYQVPGGMLSNIAKQLKQFNAEDRIHEVLEEVQKVREDFGYPPLVAPVSQIIATQAIMNTIFSERYGMVPKESKALVKGEMGKTPVPVSNEIKSKILGNEDQISCRPADLLEPELDTLREKIKNYIKQDEDVLSYALLPRTAEKFFQSRTSQEILPVVEEELVDDDETIAVVTAVLACMEKAQGTKMVVRSIRDTQRNINLWRTAGRQNSWF